MKTANENTLDNNGTNVWNKLDTDITDSYSPPILENSDVLDLQRNKVRLNKLRFLIFFYRCKFEYILNFIFAYRHLKNYEPCSLLSLLIKHICSFIDASIAR